MIQAKSDMEAVNLWLSDYSQTRNTFSSYKRESERFLLWCQHHQLSLSKVSRESIISYRHFLKNPGKQWVSITKHPRQDPRWKPFSGPLSAASIKQSETILSHLYTWLIKAGYLQSNPFSLSSKRVKTGTQAHSMRDAVIERHLPESLWQIIMNSISEEDDVLKQLRNRWIMTLLKSTGLRISEAVHLKFYQLRESTIRDPKDNSKVIHFWMLDVIGKGDKSRKIPLDPKLLALGRDYCEAHGLNFEAIVKRQGKEDIGYPVIMPLRGSLRRGLSRSGLHLIVKEIFHKAAFSINDESQREKLLLASCHWLRHTAGTTMANNGTDVRIIKEVLGHASLDTSSIYLHLEDDLALYQGVLKPS